jgi:hypothetical protein
MPRARLAPTLCALIALALFSATPIAAEPPADTTSTTVADDTFGEGGTRQTFSNAKHELTAEVWRDKNGIVREQYEVGAAGEQYWGFFNGTGEGEPKNWRKSVLAIRPMARPPGRFELLVLAADDSTIKEMSTLTKSELDTEFEYWHAQLRLWVNTARRRQQGETGCVTCPH